MAPYSCVEASAAPLPPDWLSRLYPAPVAGWGALGPEALVLAEHRDVLSLLRPGLLSRVADAANPVRACRLATCWDST